MLSLENTASRMSHLARQEIYFDRHFGLDETLSGVERVTNADVQRVATDLFSNGSLRDRSKPDLRPDFFCPVSPPTGAIMTNHDG